MNTGVGSQPGAREWRRLAVFAGFAGAAVLISLCTPAGRWFRVESIRRIADRLGALGPAVIIGLGTVSPLFFLPRWPVAFVSGLLYGVTAGTLLATLASTLGAWLHFVLASSLLAPAAARARQRFRLTAGTIPREKTFVVLLFLRAFPLSNFVATNLIAGALKMDLRLYLAASFVGMLPSSLMYASWGKLMKKPSGWFYLVAVLSLAFVVLGTVVAQKRFVPWLRNLRRDAPAADAAAQLE